MLPEKREVDRIPEFSAFFLKRKEYLAQGAFTWVFEGMFNERRGVMNQLGSLGGVSSAVFLYSMGHNPLAPSRYNVQFLLEARA